MAQAICQHEIRERFGQADRFSVLSAGVAAMQGMPASPEVAQALDRLGIGLHEHQSQPLTRELLHDADIVFGLTQSHVQAIESLALDSQQVRIELLDPQQQDIPDPIGCSVQVYEQTARTLWKLIKLRLEELSA